MDTDEKVEYIKVNLQYCSDQSLWAIDRRLIQSLSFLERKLGDFIRPHLEREGLKSNIRNRIGHFPDNVIDDIYEIVKRCR